MEVAPCPQFPLHFPPEVCPGVYLEACQKVTPEAIVNLNRLALKTFVSTKRGLKKSMKMEVSRNLCRKKANVKYKGILKTREQILKISNGILNKFRLILIDFDKIRNKFLQKIMKFFKFYVKN